MIVTTLLLPVFFVFSGLNTRIGLLNSRELLGLTLLVMLLAIAGKGVACMLAARWGGESWRDSAAIGTLMNARGLMELIILNIGLQNGVIQPTLFTIFILMAIVTTVMASPLYLLIAGRARAGVRRGGGRWWLGNPWRPGRGARPDVVGRGSQSFGGLGGAVGRSLPAARCRWASCSCRAGGRPLKPRVEIEFTGVGADSRRPTTTCVWSGNAEVEPR
jgi:hypothetical protein